MPQTPYSDDSARVRPWSYGQDVGANVHSKSIYENQHVQDQGKSGVLAMVGTLDIAALFRASSATEQRG
jgi:hypothetical protein